MASPRFSGNEERIYAGTVGKTLKLDTKLDLTGVGTLEIVVDRNVAGVWTETERLNASLAAGSNQIIEAKTTADTFPTAGDYRIRAYASFPGSEPDYGDQTEIQVFE